MDILERLVRHAEIDENGNPKAIVKVDSTAVKTK